MTSPQSARKKLSEHEESYKRCRSRDYSPSSTQVIIEQDDASTLAKGSTSNKRGSNGDETVYTPKKYDRRKDYQRDSSTDSSTSSASVQSNDVKSTSKVSESRYSKTKSSRKEGKYRDNQPATYSRARDRSARFKKSPEYVPYFADPKREEDRLRRKYGESSRSRRRSGSRTRRRSRTRSYSRERRRGSHRSKSRERRRSSSYDRHRSRRRSRSPGRRHDPAMLMPEGPPFIPVVPVPYPPHFYAPRFPHGAMLRPPFPPPVVYYVPHPMLRPMGRWFVQDEMINEMELD